MKSKKCIAIFAFIIILVTLGVTCVCAFLSRDDNMLDYNTAAKADYALQTLKDSCGGNSKIDVFANLKEARGSKDPVAYLVENSTFLIDSEAVEKEAAARMSGLESTASATKTPVSELLNENGYDTVEAYKEAMSDEVTLFIKSRLCIYEAARELKIEVKDQEYEALLPKYAEHYGYEDVESFTNNYFPGTIACEMLYQKTINVLKEG